MRGYVSGEGKLNLNTGVYPKAEGAFDTDGMVRVDLAYNCCLYGDAAYLKAVSSAITKAINQLHQYNVDEIRSLERQIMDHQTAINNLQNKLANLR